jgi:F-type H+-transporting ATPase subunit gamma
MMATLEDLARHIEVAEDLQSVVRTMKTISAVAIRRHELAEEAMSRYRETVELGLQVALRAFDRARAEAPPPAGGRTAVVLVGSEIGLCGAFNDRLVTFALESLAATGDDAAERLVLTIGARADASWRAEAEPPAAHEEAPATVETLAHTVSTVLTRLDHWREEKASGGSCCFTIVQAKWRRDAGAGPPPADRPALARGRCARVVGRRAACRFRSDHRRRCFAG